MKVLFLLFLLLISFRSFCQYENIKSQGMYSSSFLIDEKTRSITYYMPATYAKQESYPLLIVLSADKSDAASLIKKYGDAIQAKADSAGCIVLYPDAYKGHWNSDPKDTVNDVGFISIMAEFFLRQFDCDLSEMRLFGIGNGGNLCYRYDCESIHKPAAIATINATIRGKNFSGCQNPQIVQNRNTITESVSKTNLKEALNRLFAYKN